MNKQRDLLKEGTNLFGKEVAGCIIFYDKKDH